jgi:uncharacterized protein YggL (DUF469 family)
MAGKVQVVLGGTDHEDCKQVVKVFLSSRSAWNFLDSVGTRYNATQSMICWTPNQKFKEQYPDITCDYLEIQESDLVP